MHSCELNQVAYVLLETGSSSYVQQVEEICLFSMRGDRKDERIRIRMRPKKFMDDRYGLINIRNFILLRKYNGLFLYGFESLKKLLFLKNFQF